MTVCVVAGLARQAEQQPNPPAIIAPNLTLTWGELGDTASRIATLLKHRGVGRGQVVAINSNYSPAMEATLIAAVWWVGGATAVFTDQQWNDLPFTPDFTICPSATSKHAGTKIVIDTATLDRLGGWQPADPASHHDDDVLHIVFSSGTTGRPKPVVFPAVTQHRRAYATELPYMTTVGPTGYSWFAGLLFSLREGEPLHLPGDTAETLQVLRKHRVRSLSATPAQVAALCDLAERTHTSPSGLRTVLAAGAAWPDTLVARIRKTLGAKTINLYAGTEMAGVATDPHPDCASNRVGTLLPGVTVEIVDDTHQPVAEGETGRIRVHNPCFPTYYHGPDPNLWDDDTGYRDGWVYPGDLGYLQNGQLFVRGRINDVINAAGVKVYPADVERVIASQPGVKDVACAQYTRADGLTAAGVLVVPDPDMLGGQPDPDSPRFDLDNVRRTTARTLGEMTPELWLVSNHIPRNTNGKIDRAGVTSLLEQPQAVGGNPYRTSRPSERNP